MQTLSEIKAKGEKVIVFTLWKSMQSIISKVIHEHFDVVARTINGETNSRDPDEADRIINYFSKTKGFDVLIASPIAAGAGLNIVAANHVIHYGRWWNPAKEDQATCRAYRIGQEREVHVYYPILHHPDNVEEGFDIKLNALVEKKRKLATDFLNPVGPEISANEFENVIYGVKK